MTCVQYAQVERRPSVLQQQHYELLQSMKFTDELLLLRHGERLDHVDRAWRNTMRLYLPETDPPLSTAGRRQALETGLMFLKQQQRAKIRQRAQGMLSFLLVSPFHRCIETALIVNLVGFHGKLAMFVDPLLSDWHSPKFFSRPPRLAGRYTSYLNTIAFRPKWEILGTSLLPFLRSILLDTQYAIDTAIVEGWIAIVENKWLKQEPSFLVWTSSSAQKSLQRGIHAEMERTEHMNYSNRSNNSNNNNNNNNNSSGSNTGGNSVTTTTNSTTNNNNNMTITNNNSNNNNNNNNNIGGFTGISYPENASSLMRRVSEAMRVHFDSGTTEKLIIPTCVWEAIRQEAQRLPRVFVPRSNTVKPIEEKEKDKQYEYKQEHKEDISLLPPTRVMMITHADVVSMVLKHCCPKYHGVDSGFSVPYCSLTSFSRRNNFYCVKSDNSSLSSSLSSSSSTHNNSNKSSKSINKSHNNNNKTNNNSVTASSGEFPLEWSVTAEGSTKHLQTTILLQYS